MAKKSKSKPKNGTKVSPEMAAKILQEQREKRYREFERELTELLEKYDLRPVIHEPEPELYWVPSRKGE